MTVVKEFELGPKCKANHLNVSRVKILEKSV